MWPIGLDPLTHHLKCVGLTAAPKKTFQICWLCYGTEDAVDGKETAETEVRMCSRSYSMVILFSVECQDTNERTAE